MLRLISSSTRSTFAVNSLRATTVVSEVQIASSSRRTLADKTAVAAEAKTEGQNNEDTLASFKALNNTLLDRKTKDAQVLARLINNTPSEQFNAVNSASAIYRLGRLVPTGKDPLWDVSKAAKKLATIAQDHANEHGARETTRLLFGVAVGRLNKSNQPAFQSLLDKILSCQSTKLKSYSVEELGQLAWSLAKIGNPQAVGFVKTIINEVQSRKASELSAKDVSDFAWAMSQTGVKDQGMLELISKQLSEPGALAAYEPKDLAQIVWAMAKLEYKNETLLRKIVEEVKNRGGLATSDFALQRVSQLVWGLAALGHKDEDLLKEVISISQRKLPYFSEQSIKDLEFAFWTFKSDEFAQLVEAQKQKQIQANEKKAAKKQLREEETRKKAEEVQQKLLQKQAVAALAPKKAGEKQRK